MNMWSMLLQFHRYNSVQYLSICIQHPRTWWFRPFSKVFIPDHNVKVQSMKNCFDLEVLLDSSKEFWFLAMFRNWDWGFWQVIKYFCHDQFWAIHNINGVNAITQKTLSGIFQSLAHTSRTLHSKGANSDLSRQPAWPCHPDTTHHCGQISDLEILPDSQHVSRGTWPSDIPPWYQLSSRFSSISSFPWLHCRQTHATTRSLLPSVFLGWPTHIFSCLHQTGLQFFPGPFYPTTTSIACGRLCYENLLILYLSLWLLVALGT